MRTLMLCLLFCGVASANNPAVKVGGWLILSAPADVSGLSWEYDPVTAVEGDVKLFELKNDVTVIEKIDPKKIEPVSVTYKSGSVVVIGLKPGNVRVVAYGVVNGVPKRVVSQRITVEGDTPTPPGPVPPGPVPPVPVDLKVKLSTAFAADGGPTADNKKHVNAASGVYRAGAAMAPTAAVATGGQLVAAMAVLAQANGLSVTTIPATLKAVSSEMQAVLKDATIPLTPEKRQQTADLLNGVSGVLGELGK